MSAGQWAGIQRGNEAYAGAPSFYRFRDSVLPDAGRKPWGLVMMIYTWFMIIFGWIAATAVVAGVTRIFRRR